MINTQLISFNEVSPSYNSVISTAESLTQVFTTTQVLSIIAIITAIASVLFGAYKLATHLAYFLPKDQSETRPIPPSAPEREDAPFEIELLRPSAPPMHEVFSESAPEMQEQLFKQFLVRFS